ncbi:NADH-quinone oxidoreductase subunit NuoE [Ammonifex thiophilus]|uniref:NADH-quinone oxidoreductase subunit NuoE n=1 Tax=Ammonifex thiophilus TaxID=444093 RepID=A0A3D8P545_9THEO|nr:NADH-quinone oxidoreductase subunit NuoE [Ammonifex thiophilus]RDV84334.1 NADH-quinone oxidoreductase subunit NuoE [Ammonifex thiophilus]
MGEAILEEVVRSYRGRPEKLIAALLALQRHYGYLPEPALRTLAQELGVPLSKVYGVATFYAQFRLKPRGRHTVCVCLGTACHVRGSEQIFHALKRELGVEPGDTTADGRFTLEVVSCVGACSMAPVVVVDEETHGRLDPEKALALLKKY